MSYQKDNIPHSRHQQADSTNLGHGRNRNQRWNWNMVHKEGEEEGVVGEVDMALVDKV